MRDKGADDRLAPLVGRALARLRAATGADLTFAGRAIESAVQMVYFDGQVVGPLRGVILDPGYGIAGRVMVRRHPIAVTDYARTSLIIHTRKNDSIIRAEALRSMAAAPIIVGRKQLGVIYAAHRDAQDEMGHTVDAVIEEARSLEQALAVFDVLRYLRTDSEKFAQEVWRAKVQSAYLQLRMLANDIADRELQSRLRDCADILAGDAADGDLLIRLTPREQDVLTLLASGMTNSTIAERLGIGLYTVKDHVKSLMVKLDAQSRFEAVVIARRVRLLP